MREQEPEKMWVLRGTECTMLLVGVRTERIVPYAARAIWTWHSTDARLFRAGQNHGKKIWSNSSSACSCSCQSKYTFCSKRSWTAGRYRCTKLIRNSLGRLDQAALRLGVSLVSSRNAKGGSSRLRKWSRLAIFAVRAVLSSAVSRLSSSIMDWPNEENRYLWSWPRTIPSHLNQTDMVQNTHNAMIVSGIPQNASVHEATSRLLRKNIEILAPLLNLGYDAIAAARLSTFRVMMYTWFAGNKHRFDHSFMAQVVSYASTGCLYCSHFGLLFGHHPFHIFSRPLSEWRRTLTSSSASLCTHWEKTNSLTLSSSWGMSTYQCHPLAISGMLIR